MQSSPPTPRTLGFLLRDASRLMRRRFVQRAKEAGLPLNRSEASVLVQVDREPGLSQAQLAEQMDMEAVSLVRLVDSLQQAGLIERRLRPYDRRIRTLWLTAAAQPILAQVHAIAAEVRAQALAGMADCEREMLLDLLMTVRSNLAAPGRGNRDPDVVEHAAKAASGKLAGQSGVHDRAGDLGSRSSHLTGTSSSFTSRRTA